MLRTSFTVIALFAALFLVVGCQTKEGKDADAKNGPEETEDKSAEGEGSGESTEKPAEEPAEKPAEEPAPPAEGAESPEKVIEGLKKVMWEDKDLVGTLDYIVPEDRAMMVFGVDMFMGFIFFGMKEEKKKEAEEELGALHKKHNIPQKEEGKEEEPLDPTDTEKLKAAAKEHYKNTDVKAYFKDILAFMKKYSDKEQKMGKKGATLKDVKIEGDKATATLEFEDGSNRVVEFLEIDGRWFITLESLQGK
jgi:hypothetical protein